ncbi:cytoplasmic polyadenylation element-binding protein 4 isoform X1, partial [Lates japonicus]
MPTSSPELWPQKSCGWSALVSVGYESQFCSMHHIYCRLGFPHPGGDNPLPLNARNYSRRR